MSYMSLGIHGRSLLLSALCWCNAFCLSALSPAFGKDDNSSTLSELELAKRDAEDFEKLAKLVKPSVVVIESVDRLGREGGRGTGFVIRKDGVIATNFHVIGDARPVHVEMSDGRKLRVTAIHASDRKMDLAVIRVAEKDLPALSLGNPENLKKGAPIVVMGNPHGLKNNEGSLINSTKNSSKPVSSSKETIDIESSRSTRNWLVYQYNIGKIC